VACLSHGRCRQASSTCFQLALRRAMRKSNIGDIPILAVLLLPFVIGLVFNTHPQSAGPFGCFMKETPPPPRHAWQIDRDLKDARNARDVFYNRPAR
jgi:hypothetical protein